MLLRLTEIQNSMKYNLEVIESVQEERHDPNNLTQMETIFNYMNDVGLRCKDANQMILELTSRYH